MNRITVAVTVNENYLYPLRVMLYSLFNTQKDNVTVLLVHSRIRNEYIKELEAFCHSYGSEFKEVLVDENQFDCAPLRKYFSKEMYYRLIFPWVLEEEERVIYLDPDIIVNTSLQDFWNLDLGENFMAAARERLLPEETYRKKLGLMENSVYMNSGVLLMDLKKMRERRRREDIESLIEEIGEYIKCPDQDTLNIFWEGEIKQVEDAYNLNPNILYLKEYLSVFSFMNRDAKIVHYMGQYKPWIKNYKGGKYFLWAKAEWHVYPKKRMRIFFRILMEPYRFVYGLYLFWKHHDWSGKKTSL